MTWVLGVDGGGTKTTVAIMDQWGEVLGTATAGSSNFDDHGVERATRNLRQAVDQARLLAKMEDQPFDSVFLGLGGATSPKAREIAKSIAMTLPLTPQAQIGVDDDARVALAGGLMDQPGLALIAGTGSVCIGLNQSHQIARAGGWGAMFDDLGSGHWLGLAVLRAAVSAFDGRSAPTMLLEQVQSELGLEDMTEMLHRLYVDGLSRSEIAAMARVALSAAESGDGVALKILEQAAVHLVEMVVAVATRLEMLTTPYPITMIGGLWNSVLFKTAFTTRLAALLPQIKVVSPSHPPEIGACSLALKALGLVLPSSQASAVIAHKIESQSRASVHAIVDPIPELLQIQTQYHHRVWGGQMLKSSLEQPIGEAWLVYQQNIISSGTFAGQTLEHVCQSQGVDLLGARAVKQTGLRFPILIKILDCADWLSVQVHPNDTQALTLEGAGQFGKTEAWQVLAAQPGAELIAGVKPDTTVEQLERAIREGTILERSQKHHVEAGDTVMMPAGTLHALGPGLLIYEVQQTSDITYRVWDWDRSSNAGRSLHLEQSIAVTNPLLQGEINRNKILESTGIETRAQCPYFTLEQIQATDQTLELDTQHASFHTITITQGRAVVIVGQSRVELGLFETVIVPANAGKYQIQPLEAFTALRCLV